MGIIKWVLNPLRRVFGFINLFFFSCYGLFREPIFMKWVVPVAFFGSAGYWTASKEKGYKARTGMVCRINFNRNRNQNRLMETNRNRHRSCENFSRSFESELESELESESESASSIKFLRDTMSYFTIKVDFFVKNF